MKAGRRPLLLVALGGNALLRHDQEGTYEEQETQARQTGLALRPLLDPAYDLILTHGNGPQVGNLLLQNEVASNNVPALPLHACVAKSQGLIGSILQSQLLGLLREADIRRYVITMITQVIVDDDDPAFENPSKPIGPYFSPEEARELKREKGWKMIEQSDRGYRRIVPSPDPKKVIQRFQIRDVARSGQIAIALGGGGVPVVEREQEYRPVNAVVDKDIASALLAQTVGCDKMIILTDVDRVYRNYNTPAQEPVHRMSIAEARDFMEEGHARKGSMKPKIEAAVQFVEDTENEVLITSPEALPAAIDGTSGTWISPDGSMGALHAPEREQSLFPDLDRFREQS